MMMMMVVVGGDDVHRGHGSGYNDDNDGDINMIIASTATTSIMSATGRAFKFTVCIRMSRAYHISDTLSLN